MLNDWPPEPWTVDILGKCQFCDGHHADILDADGKIVEGPYHFVANAERIAACVSACAGVPTEDLIAKRYRIMSVDIAKEATDGQGDTTT